MIRLIHLNIITRLNTRIRVMLQITVTKNDDQFLQTKNKVAE